MSSWSPAVDIREDVEMIVLEADLPGLNQDDIKVTLEDNVLTISGDRKFAEVDGKEHFHRVERCYGTFSRSFSLPENIDTSKIDATFRDGVLEIVLIKRQPDLKKVKIKVG